MFYLFCILGYFCEISKVIGVAWFFRLSKKTLSGSNVVVSLKKGHQASDYWTFKYIGDPKNGHSKSGYIQFQGKLPSNG
jgi:hypothetical protein